MTQLLDPEMQSLLVNGLLHEARMATASTHSSNAQVGDTELQRQRPSVLYRPTLFWSGCRWEAAYGQIYMQPNSGVAGWGQSPEEAMANFDKNWVERTV